MAIGARNGNPILAVTGGASFADGGAVFGLGKVLSRLGPNGDAHYVEADMQGVTALLDAAQRAREQARETLPEFLFTDSGANSSGDALSWRATAFTSKIEEIRGRWFDQIARLTAIACAMDEGRAFDPARDRLEIEGSPILPAHIKAEIEALHLLLDKRGILRRDYIARLQALGVISNDHTPEEYAAEVDAEQDAAAQTITEREVDAVRRATSDALPTVTTETLPE
jgi:hypothetical protein